MPMALRFTALDLDLGLEGIDDFDEDFLEVLLGIFFAQLGEGAFGQQFAVVNDADDVAELFDFAHDVRGEDDGFTAVAALADEGGDGASGHDVEAESGLVEDHHRRVMDQGASDGGFLLHAGGKLVAAAVAEGVHIEAIENDVEALFERGFVETVEAAEIFDEFLGGEAGVERGGGGKKADVGAHFFGMLDDVVAADEGGAVGGFQDGGEHAQGGGFAGAVGAEQAVDAAGLAAETDVIDGTDLAALFVVKAFGQATSLNHLKTPRRVLLERTDAASKCTTRGEEETLQSSHGPAACDAVLGDDI